MSRIELCCPLCSGIEPSLFYQDKRDYYQCADCFMVFIPAHQFVSIEQEKSVYDQHINLPDDMGYRHFLNRLFIPVSKCLQPDNVGLDFGSGPGPTLSLMFLEAGYSMKIYDIFYADDRSVLSDSYHFITASEVVEHLHHPKKELDRLWSCLEQNGILGIMTKRVLDQQAFSQWHYKNDPTHVIFFSRKTFQWLADYWGAKVSFPEKDVVIFRKMALA